MVNVGWDVVGMILRLPTLSPRPPNRRPNKLSAGDGSAFLRQLKSSNWFPKWCEVKDQYDVIIWRRYDDVLSDYLSTSRPCCINSDPRGGDEAVGRGCCSTVVNDLQPYHAWANHEAFPRGPARSWSGSWRFEGQHAALWCLLFQQYRDSWLDWLDDQG